MIWQTFMGSSMVGGDSLINSLGEKKKKKTKMIASLKLFVWYFLLLSNNGKSAEITLNKAKITSSNPYLPSCDGHVKKQNKKLWQISFASVYIFHNYININILYL
jgi:hypothetical protein